MTDRNSGAKSDWLRHEYTEMVLRQLSKDRAIAFKNFVSACMSTTDPLVARAYEQWRANDINVVAFGGEEQ